VRRTPMTSKRGDRGKVLAHLFPAFVAFTRGAHEGCVMDVVGHLTVKPGPKPACQLTPSFRWARLTSTFGSSRSNSSRTAL